MVGDLRQKDIFSASEGDNWFNRNKEALAGEKGKASYSVVRALEMLPLTITSTLEIGCSSGQRLAAIVERFGGKGSGIDPSSAAIENGKATYPHFDLRVATADRLPFEDNSFDLVVFGFCLCLVDPCDHFKAMAEADRVLRDGGALVINDFLEPNPYFNDWHHQPDCKCYKMDYSRYLLASPAYTLIARIPAVGDASMLQRDKRSTTDVLIKNLGDAFRSNSVW
jgi:ubiquinone/menaquinone biosynthesis C-methylase UbiE